VLARGRLVPMPTGTMLGVQSDPAARAGILNPEEVRRAAKERSVPAPPLERDVAVRPWLSARLGPAVVDRLVEPLLGGVYAGHAAKLSLRATMPLLWQAGRAGGSLLDAVARNASAPSSAPVFAGLRGGVGRLPEELAARLDRRGVMIVLGVPIRGLRRTRGGWQLVSGPAAREQTLTVDGVVLAVPPGAAGRLLAAEVPAAAAELAAVETASVAVVTALVPREELAGVSGSGFLLPPMEGYAVKGVTFSAAKWAWTDRLDERLVPVRMSLGRAGEEAILQRDDTDLAALAVADLGSVLGRTLHPVVTKVTRWGGALPQYAVGHVERIARVREAVAAVPGLAVCGAVMDGVGIPACIAAAYRAAEEVTARLPAGALVRPER
jgi:oxygen-dependent protoporphyrinogen oxidase